ncbi:MAG: ATP-binding protein [Bdellovibrio sp.]|nr:ATP-binding protein [Bdellovibrio sp.]
MIHQQIKSDLEIDLLKSKYFLPLNSNPSLLEDWTSQLKAGAWIYIDEIQKIPALMDEVHSLYENKKFNFALSGSSARKLKRGGGNLLAGRAISVQLFPFTYFEYSSIYSLDEAIQWGSLPQVVTEPDSKIDFLYSYVETYLREELIEEGMIRKLEPFLRVLQILGVYNGQVLNTENIARESYVSRTTVDKYFQVIEDTLIGFRLQPLKIKWNKKELTHPKFYLFDVGVARACGGLLNQELDPSQLGHAFESLVIGEVKAYNSYLKLNRTLSYYKYSGGYEIDLLIESRKKTLTESALFTAIEIKFAKLWDSRWNSALFDLQDKSKGKINRLVGVYRGSKKLHFKNIEIYPVEQFLELLAQGQFLNPLTQKD